jgi:methylisocitrate lyase
MAERAGFQAAYLSGGALSAGWAGVPDVGLLSQTEFADQIAVLSRATALPLLCDADTGFGSAIHVERTVRLYENAGAAGLHIEDQDSPKRCGQLSGKSLVDVATMCTKIRAAVVSRRDSAFVIIARTDARAGEGLSAAVDRARAYLEAGADGIFPEALETEAEFAAFARNVPSLLLANMTEFGKSPLLDVATLGRLGYRGILFPLTAFRAAMRAARDTLAEIRRLGTQKPQVSQMLTRAELYDLIGYSDYEARDRAFFGTTRE